MLLINSGEAWAGTADSLQDVLKLQETLHLDALKSPEALSPAVASDANSLLQVVDGVAVVSIRGPLLAESSWYSEMMDLTTYPKIRDALVRAAEDPSVSSILLDVNSPGGSVNGVQDTGDLISAVGKLKPVVAYASGAMASAAYWLGVSAAKIFASKTSDVGSIGVITSHTDFSKRLGDMGVKTTVLRAGKYKALAQPTEPLSDPAREQIQSQLDTYMGLFTGHVAEHRGMTPAQVDKTIGQGRDFIGVDALAAGAVDGIKSFDEVMQYMRSSAKALDYKQKFHETPSQTKRGEKPMKRALSKAAYEAAISEGVDASTIELVSDDAAAAAQAGTPVLDAAPPVSTPPPVETPAVDAAAAPAGDSAVVSMLREQLREREAAAVEAAVTIRDLTAQVQATKDTQEALCSIARASVQKMQVALGGRAGEVASLSAVDLVAEHKRVSEVFAESFKVGGVAAVVPDGEKPAQKAATPNPVATARIQATRINRGVK